MTSDEDLVNGIAYDKLSGPIGVNQSRARPVDVLILEFSSSPN